jgi:tetratricopeptide (TPR) repeat protein
MIRNAPALVLALALSGCRCLSPAPAPAPTPVPVPPHGGEPDTSTDAAFAKGVEAELRAQTLKGEPRQQELDRAFSSYSAVLEREPNDAPALSNRANILLELGDTVGAIRDLERAIANSDGNDRGFYLRRAGDAYGRAGHHGSSMLCYWQALEWDPQNPEAHGHIVDELPYAPPLQLTNYLRFLLETRQTERVIAAAAAVPTSADASSAAAAALAAAAPLVPPERLETIAVPFTAVSPAAGSELQHVLRGEPASFAWLEAHAEKTGALGAPPHAAYRALSQNIGTAAAARGDLERAERQLRLTVAMPGADASDVRQLLAFLAQYRTLPDVRAEVERQERRAVPTSIAEVPFHRTSIDVYALYDEAACGDETWGIRHHARRLAALGADVPAIAGEICRDVAAITPVPDRSCNVYGFSENDRTGTLIALPPDSNEEALECAVNLIAADYRPDRMPPLRIEAPPAAYASAERLRDRLIAAGIEAGRITIELRAGARLRVRLAP